MRRIKMDHRIARTVLPMVLLTQSVIGAPIFWVKCTSCEATHTNSASRTTRFHCGTGMYPVMFAVLTQCEKSRHLATVNLMKPYETKALDEVKAGRKPNWPEMRKQLRSFWKAYDERTVTLTNTCSLCGESLKLVYFSFNKMPDSARREEVKLHLPAPCPSCSSNTLWAVSTGDHMD